MVRENFPATYLPFEAEGLPTLYGAKGCWETALHAPRTASLRDGPHPGGLFRRARPVAEAGEVEAIFENDDGSDDAPDPSMLAGGRWLVAKDAAFAEAIVSALLAELPVLRKLQDAVVLEDDAFRLPANWDEPTLRGLVRLNHVNLMPVASADGRPYIGADFDCVWEREHGCGLLLLGTEVIEIGGGNVAAEAWRAVRHVEGDPA